MSELAGQVALVMGAGGGLGRAISLALAHAEASLALNDLSPVSLEETLALLQAQGASARDYVFDIGKKMPLQALVSQVVDELGRIDILVNAAPVQPVVPLLEMDEWDWHRTLDVNLGGPFFALQVVGRQMRAQGGGCMLNIVLPPEQAVQHPGRAALAASQAGLVSLTQAAALELAPYHIRVNAVMPVLLPPERLPAAATASRTGRVAYQPLEDPACLSALAEKVLYLCSPAAQAINGQVLRLE
jgi:NAD(P)-dependent dehydrogenase (short-subunit alcohol dehydrogenase family)